MQTVHFMMRVGACLLAGASVQAWSQPAGDVKRGSDVFAEQCSECHSIREGKNKKGPSVFAVFGRKAAALPGVEYSDALRATNWVWDEERLRYYLSQPSKKANPGSKMKYDGLPDTKELGHLLAYLATVK